LNKAPVLRGGFLGFLGVLDKKFFMVYSWEYDKNKKSALSGSFASNA